MSHRWVIVNSVLAMGLAFVVAGCQTGGRLPAAAAPTQRAAPQPQVDEREPRLYLAVIGQLIERGMDHAALAHLDEFEHRYGVTPDSHRLRGDAWLALGTLDNAAREYETIAQGPMAGFGSHGLGRVAAARENWALASAYFEEAARLQPTNVIFINDYGCALFQLGRFEEARFQLEKAAELSPSDPEVGFNLKTVLALAERQDPQAESDASQSEDAP